MNRVIILHAWGNTSREHWYPWLKTELKTRGYAVTIPNFPDTDNPILSKWLQKLSQEEIDQNTILVGHSLGSVTILRYLQSLPSAIKILAVVLVAGFFRPNPAVDEKPIFNFLTPKWEWDQIIPRAKQWFVINSDNDPYIPLKDSQELSENLHQKLILMPGAGHFSATTDPKYTQFSYLLEIFNKLENNG